MKRVSAGAQLRPGIAAALLAATLAGCASAPPAPAPVRPHASDETANRAVDYAREMLGKPYRYAGDTPAGFDCSGLVRYSYGRAGIRLPRDTQDQRRYGAPVPVGALRVGDLLFFDQEGKKNSHVGIYLGGGKFVHAPSSGKKVRSDRLDAPYWRKHFSGARRLAV